MVSLCALEVSCTSEANGLVSKGSRPCSEELTAAGTTGAEGGARAAGGKGGARPVGADGGARPVGANGGTSCVDVKFKSPIATFPVHKEVPS